MIRAVGKCEGDFTGGRREWEVKKGGINKQKIDQGL
jgi:hypothetical protein